MAWCILTLCFLWQQHLAAQKTLFQIPPRDIPHSPCQSNHGVQSDTCNGRRPSTAVWQLVLYSSSMYVLHLCVMLSYIAQHRHQKRFFMGVFFQVYWANTQLCLVVIMTTKPNTPVPAKRLFCFLFFYLGSVPRLIAARDNISKLLFSGFQHVFWQWGVRQKKTGLNRLLVMAPSICQITQSHFYPALPRLTQKNVCDWKTTIVLSLCSILQLMGTLSSHW